MSTNNRGKATLAVGRDRCNGRKMWIAAFALLALQAGPTTAVAQDEPPLPPGMTEAAYNLDLGRAMALGAARLPATDEEREICDDLTAAIDTLVVVREETLARLSSFDEAYAEQVTENRAAIARTGSAGSTWHTTAMDLMRLKRAEMAARVDDQNISLFALSRASLAYCLHDWPNRP